MIEANAYKPRWFQTPLLLPLLAAVAATPWMAPLLGMTNIIYLIIVVQTFMFLLVFRRPAWAMASLIVGQFTIPSFMIPLFGTLVSIRFIWTVLAVLILLPVLIKERRLELGNGAKRIILPAVLFCIIATISNLINTDLNFTVQYLRIIATWLIILCLLPATIKNEKDVRLLAWVALIVGSISAAAAVMQHYSDSLGLPVLVIDPSMWGGHRAPGLTEGSVQLAFILPVILIPLVAMYFMGGVGRQRTKYLLLAIFLIAVGLYFTYTRSGMYALAPGLLAMILILKGHTRTRLLLVTAILGIAFLGYTAIKDNRFIQSFGEESSAAVRLVLWQAGLNVALDNPIIGIGHDRFRDVSSGYSSTINPTFMETLGVGEELGMHNVHNDFLNVWASFGTVALMLYLWLYVNIFRNFWNAYIRSQTRFLKALSVGCFGAMGAYIMNAATHNQLDNTTIIWILGGLSIALVKLTDKKQFDRI